MKAKLTISALLLVLLAPAWLCYLHFAWQKEQLREKVKVQLLAGMDEAELVTLKFSKADANVLLKWEHSREFEYQGQMYDLVEKAERGDSLHLRCFPDGEETELNNKLEKLLATATGGASSEKSPTSRLPQFLQSLFCPEQAVWPPFPEALPRLAFFYSAPLTQFIPSPSPSPPRLFL